MAVHESRYRILYRDIDSMGVLYYGRYLALFELGRTDWQREEGLRYRAMEEEEGKMLPVLRAECRYLAPLRFDDLALIRTEVLGWSAGTLSFRHEILCEETGKLCATGGVELGCVRCTDFKPTRLPGNYLDLLARKAPGARGRRGLSPG